MTCVKCGSNNTTLFRGDDGHFRKNCGDCGHTGGPYVSDQPDDNGDTGGPEGEATLDDFA